MRCFVDQNALDEFLQTCDFKTSGCSEVTLSGKIITADTLLISITAKATDLVDQSTAVIKLSKHLTDIRANLVIEFVSIPHLTSMGMGALIKLAGIQSINGFQVGIINTDKNFKELLNLTHFCKVISIHDSVDSAIRMLSGKYQPTIK